MLTEPDTAPMTPEQHEQAVNTLAAMIVAGGDDPRQSDPQQQAT